MCSCLCEFTHIRFPVEISVISGCYVLYICYLYIIIRNVSVQTLWRQLLMFPSLLIYFQVSEGEPTEKDALQPGHNIVCAGYTLYGSATLVAISTGAGLNFFTLDPVSLCTVSSFPRRCDGDMSSSFNILFYCYLLLMPWENIRYPVRMWRTANSLFSVSETLVGLYIFCNLFQIQICPLIERC